MSFCRYCGRKLEDGEVCNCRTVSQPNGNVSPQNAALQNAAPQNTSQPVYGEASTVQPVFQQPEQQAYTNQQPMPQPVSQPQGEPAGNLFAPILKLVKGTIKDPIGAAEDFYREAKLPSAGILIGMLAATYMICVLLYMAAVSIMVATTYGVAFDWGAGQVLMSVFFPWVYIALMGGGVVGAAFLIAKVFVKGPFDIKKVLNGCAAVVLPLAIAYFTYFVGKCFVNMTDSAGLGFFLGLIRAIFTALTYCGMLLTFLQGLNIINKEIPDKKNRLFAIIIGAATVCLVNFLLCLFMKNCYCFFTILG